VTQGGKLYVSVASGLRNTKVEKRGWFIEEGDRNFLSKNVWRKSVGGSVRELQAKKRDPKKFVERRSQSGADAVACSHVAVESESFKNLTKRAEDEEGRINPKCFLIQQRIEKFAPDGSRGFVPNSRAFG